MHVLYFHQYFNTPSAAGGIRSYEMAWKLIERGHRVTMVCAHSGKGELPLSGSPGDPVRTGVIDGIQVIQFNLQYSNYMSLPRRAWIFLRYALNSVKVALRMDYDLVFASSTPLTAGIPGIFARWIRRKPFVFEVRDLWPELPREMGVITNPVVLGLMGILEWTTYHSAHRLIGLSPGIVKGIARLGVFEENIAMIPNGCNLEIFGRSDSPWRPQGVKKNDLMAVFTGAHGIANGLDAVLDAGAELKRRKRDDIKLVLVGDGKLKPALQARTQKEGLDNVIFHPLVKKYHLAGLMADADIGMQILANVPAFYYGTSPNKFFDYIAAGLPVLNNYPGWLAEMITEYECGFAVPPEDPATFADALEKADADREELKAMGRRARKLAEKEFGRRKLADEFVDWVERSEIR